MRAKKFLDYLRNINNLLYPVPMSKPLNTNEKSSCVESYFGHLIIILRTDESDQDLQSLLMENQGKHNFQKYYNAFRINT